MQCAGRGACVGCRPVRSSKTAGSLAGDVPRQVYEALAIRHKCGSTISSNNVSSSTCSPLAGVASQGTYRTNRWSCASRNTVETKKSVSAVASHRVGRRRRSIHVHILEAPSSITRNGREEETGAVSGTEIVPRRKVVGQYNYPIHMSAVPNIEVYCRLLACRNKYEINNKKLFR